VLDAAELVFSRVGQEAASLGLIAAEAGCLVESIELAFGDKEGLARAVAARHLGGSAPAGGARRRSSATGVSRAPSPGARRAPMQARSQERLEHLLDAGERVFADVGFDAATTNMIAAESQSSIGAIYFFFDNKEALADALTVRYLDRLRSVLEDLDADPPGGDVGVSDVVDALEDLYRDRPGLGPLLQRHSYHEGHDEFVTAFHAILVERLRKVLARGRGVDPIRRQAAAETCAVLLRSVFADATAKSDAQRARLVAELKVILTSYEVIALPP
jgi:AcrR family transcriptional regulator